MPHSTWATIHPLLLRLLLLLSLLKGVLLSMSGELLLARIVAKLCLRLGLLLMARHVHDIRGRLHARHSHLLWMLAAGVRLTIWIAPHHVDRLHAHIPGLAGVVYRTALLAHGSRDHSGISLHEGAKHAPRHVRNRHRLLRRVRALLHAVRMMLLLLLCYRLVLLDDETRLLASDARDLRLDVAETFEVEAVLLQMRRDVLARQTGHLHKIEDALGHRLVDPQLVHCIHELLVQLHRPHHPRLLAPGVVARLPFLSLLAAPLPLAARPVHVLGELLVAAEHVLPDVAQLLDAHRLQQVVHRSVRDALHHAPRLPVGRHHYDRDLHLQADQFQQLEAVHVRHVDVRQHQVEVARPFPQDLDGVLAAYGRGDGIVAAAQHLLDDAKCQGVIVHRKHAQPLGELIPQLRAAGRLGGRRDFRGAAHRSSLLAAYVRSRGSVKCKRGRTRVPVGTLPAVRRAR
mmetsp:Transcript_10471/g.38568  ORF Transcript_10471/g.38568 Transcript_10471/m.38568 type:complete len:458 (-) Transcript_10471:250-1623(-)